MLLSQFIPLLLPPLCPQVSKSPFPKSAVYFCPANGFINTISRFLYNVSVYNRDFL